MLTSEIGGNTNTKMSSFMLEVYGDDPEHLKAMWNWTTSSRTFGEIDMSTEIPAALSSALTIEHQLLRDSTLCNQIVRDYLHLQEVRPPISALPNQPWQPWPSIFRNDFGAGMRCFLIRMYLQELEALVRKRISALALDSNDESFPGSFLSTDDAWNPEDIPDIVFSVAGSGKTQLLFNQLAKVSGHYLVSGRVPDTEATLDTVIKSRRGLASLDTKHLCMILDKVVPPDGGRKWFSTKFMGMTFMSREAWCTLFHNRKKTFVSAQKWAKIKGRSAFSPYDWLLFQTICTNGFDPFVETLEILLLIENWDTSLKYDDIDVDMELPTLSPIDSPPLRQICFDEAQCEIFDSQDIQSHHSFAGLQNYIHQPLLTCDSIQRQFFYRFVTAGTSLQL